jgi:hypothetical protein
MDTATLKLNLVNDNKNSNNSNNHSALDINNCQDGDADMKALLISQDDGVNQTEREEQLISDFTIAQDQLRDDW